MIQASVYVADSKAQAVQEASPYALYFNQTLWHHGSLPQANPQAQQAAAYYDRPASKFAYAQRSMCNKCHAKD